MLWCGLKVTVGAVRWVVKCLTKYVCKLSNWCTLYLLQFTKLAVLILDGNMCIVGLFLRTSLMYKHEMVIIPNSHQEWLIIFCKEFSILRIIFHPNIVQFYIRSMIFSLLFSHYTERTTWYNIRLPKCWLCFSYPMCDLEFFSGFKFVLSIICLHNNKKKFWLS